MTSNNIELYLNSSGHKRRIQNRIKAALPLLSLLIILGVFWWLKLTGITMSDEAFCGYTEHIHTDPCYETTLICKTEHEHTDSCYEQKLICEAEEHVHSPTCYSDINADLESAKQWEASIPGIPSDKPISEKLVIIAASQKGYRESSLNFIVDSSGVRHGYTRYGEWYGNPYGDWSTMFVSFCLNYANDDSLPIDYSGGAEMLKLEFEKIGRYTEDPEYIPKTGDIVFFDNNTTAIVKSINGTTASVIQGDYENAVSERTILTWAEDVVGYGIMPSSEESTPAPDKTTDSSVTITDSDTKETVSDSEKAEIGDSEIRSENGAIQSNEDEILMSGDFRYEADGTVTEETETVVNVPLIDYLNEKGGTYFFTLTDSQNRDLPKDENGNYIVSPDTTYRIYITADSPHGLAPGTYIYELPAGVSVAQDSGDIILDDQTNVGTWSIMENGQIIFDLNKNINNRTDVVITALMGAVFSETVDFIDFDGKISVVIEKPPEETKEISVNKWGHQGNPEDGEDPSKIYWTIELYCPPGVSPAGSILRDHPNEAGNLYTESDMENGINFGMSVCNPVTWQEEVWHSWTLYPDDPGVSWTELGWVYHIPEIGPCQWCHNVDLVNNDKVVYFWINYTSTPTEDELTGKVPYTNTVNIANHDKTGWVEFEYSESVADVVKTGDFSATENGGSFTWQIEVTIPGKVDGEKAEHFWYILDETSIKDTNGNIVGYIDNDSANATVQMERNGTLTTIPNIKDATENDDIILENSWSDYKEGAAYVRQLDVFCRCTCTEENCPEWYEGSGCGTRNWGNWDYCRCWNVDETVKIIFTYETDNAELIDRFGGLGYYLSNTARLYNKRKDSNGNWQLSPRDEGKDTISIPGYFSKELTHDFNGYVANYTITVNEAMLPLASGEPVLIHDMMTDTLAYISGSLVITWEDADGNTGTLEEGTDYTVSYDGTGNQKDDEGNTIHVLDVTILSPRPVTYTLNYDTTLILPENLSGGVKYKNSATVELWGQKITADSEEKIHADINIAARTYNVSISKTDSFNGKPLEGAVFGLYNESGGLITSGRTDAYGKLPFETDIINGIVLREHVLYYVLELEAPEGYRLDDTKYWFCFCNTKAESCPTCDLTTKDTGAFRIPYEQLGTVAIENTPSAYELPATGGAGAYKFYILSGAVILIGFVIYTVPVVYRYVWRRKRERRLE